MLPVLSVFYGNDGDTAHIGRLVSCARAVGRETAVNATTIQKVGSFMGLGIAVLKWASKEVSEVGGVH
jgi:hypothetical protein